MDNQDRINELANQIAELKAELGRLRGQEAERTAATQQLSYDRDYWHNAALARGDRILELESTLRSVLS